MKSYSLHLLNVEIQKEKRTCQKQDKTFKTTKLHKNPLFIFSGSSLSSDNYALNFITYCTMANDKPMHLEKDEGMATPRATYIFFYVKLNNN